jgi:hypothetical protein
MKTHPLNVSYLVVGLVFLGLSGSWALHQTGVIGAAEVEWLLPLSLVVAGGIGLIAFMARSLRSPRTTPPAGTDHPDYPVDHPAYPVDTAGTEPTQYVNTEGDPR